MTSQVEFNPAFLQGATQVDVSQFAHGNPVLPGEYLVDLWINDVWAGRVSIRFDAQPGSSIARPCIDRALIERLGLDFQKLSAAARAGLKRIVSAGCVDLQALIPSARVAFDLPQLRFDISVPQALTLRKPRGYVDPEFWDPGVPSGTLAYNLNAYRSTSAGEAMSDGHLDLSTGLNLGSWHLRQRSSLELSSGEPAGYQNIATYLAHDIPAIRSDLTIGDSSTDGAVFDSFGFRGLSLASDDQMLPDSQLQYAPVVHGIAHTNARVVITQNGNTILETTVSPGAFEIDDLYPTGYGGDLDVTVYEADGSQESFTVPYASVAQLLRPGVWRYSVVGGEVLQPSTSGRERFAQATLQYGFSNDLTGYSGAVATGQYAAGLLGLAINCTVGAMAIDVTDARTKLTESSVAEGQSLRLTYSKLIPYSHTSLTLATYRYSASGYYSFGDAQAAWQTTRSGADPDTLTHTRGQWQININQTLPRRWGNFYLTGSALTYWNSPGTTTQFQAGYSNHVRLWDRTLGFTASIVRQRDKLTGQPDNQLLLNFSMLLGHSPHAPTVSANLIDDTTNSVSARNGQQTLTGTLGASNQWTYNASASEASGNDAYSVNGQYRSAYTSLSAGASDGSGFTQQSLGATGGVVVHPGGITLANQLADTIGIIEAPGAQGARVTNSVGTVVDRSGYAVLPFLLAYRLNTISIDPDGAISPDVEFKSTTESVAPRLNSVVMIRFQTVGGRPILATAHLEDGTPLPFGASVYDAQNSEVGLVGQDGRIYLRGIAEAGTLIARWGDAPDQQCTFRYRLPPKPKGNAHSADPFVRIDVACATALATMIPRSDSGTPGSARLMGQP